MQLDAVIQQNRLIPQLNGRQRPMQLDAVIQQNRLIPQLNGDRPNQPIGNPSKNLLATNW
jgi:hypothetical protein